nr:helix-turn-helix transcriptional regulator [Nocardiopsis mwathae]
MTDEQDTFAARLQRLFHVVPRPPEKGGGSYSVAEVASGVGVSRQHLYDLLSGKKQRPAWELVNNIANFFGVSVVYFGDDTAAEEYAQQLELLVALGKSDVKDIALRLGQLSPQHRGLLMNMMEQLQSLEQDDADQD